ncbi:MAG: DUF167 domain-containing protein [Ilumatobacteraceae bacterium]
MASNRTPDGEKRPDDRATATWWRATADGIRITVTVTPGARRSQVIGSIGSALRVKVAARAIDGKANDELVRFLAEVFGVRRSAVTLLHGRRGRSKVVAIAGLDHPPPDLTR